MDVDGEWVKRGGALPPIPELVGELAQPTYSFVSGKFILEEKDQIKKRLGRSPNPGDAPALSFAIPDQPKAPAGARGNIGTVAIEFDPFVERDAPPRSGW